jgi:TatD DNase family protein
MTPPPVDLHAHIDAAIDAAEVVALRAAIFVATRSLDEAERALARNDPMAAWGVGCHPAMRKAHRQFDPERFGDLVGRTAFVSEVGLDGSARVGMEKQRATLDSVLGVLQRAPRITSLHSYKASSEILDCLAATPVPGAVLHWWLGDAADTERAVKLGCFFSMNASSVRRADLLTAIPPERLLTETDHPFGDRPRRSQARPGAVEDVEAAIARHHGLNPSAVRRLMWNNLAGLVSESGCGQLLPRGIRLQLIARG